MNSPSTFGGDDTEYVEFPSPVTSHQSSATGSLQHELTQIEQQLAAVQTRLNKISTSSNFKDETSSEELELLLETRGMVRYATFRIRRARRRKEQDLSTVQSTPTKGSKVRGKVSQSINGGPRDQPYRSLDTSIMEVDVEDEDVQSSRVTASDGGLSNDTAPTSITGDIDNEDDLEDTVISTPRSSKSDTALGISNLSGTEHPARRSGPSYAAQAVLDSEKNQLDTMLVNIEDDADDLMSQMFQSLYQSAIALRSCIPDTFRDHRFQGLFFAIVLFQLYLALGPLRQDLPFANLVQP